MTASAPLEEMASRNVRAAMDLVCAHLPHLSGLVGVVQIVPDDRIDVAAVFASGRIVINPQVCSAPLGDLAFVIAHELLHLALRTHDRARGDQLHAVNIAHDAIINDILCHELAVWPPPFDGICVPGSKDLSLEEVLAQSRDRSTSWGDRPSGPEPRAGRPGQPESADRAEETALGAALREAGLIEPEPEPEPDPHHAAHDTPTDVLGRDAEEAWFPDRSAIDILADVVRVEQAAREAAALEVAIGRLEDLHRPGFGTEPGHESTRTAALHAAFQLPWTRLVQRWLDAQSESSRTWARPSRRSGDRLDVVLPGRARDGWTVHIVVDTSASMTHLLPLALGAIGWMSQAAGAYEVHIVQVDVEVSRDELVAPEQLADFEIAGLGGTDLYPALDHLALDPRVEAVLVISDGDLDPDLTRRFPFMTAWLVFDHPRFTHGDDQIIHVDTSTLRVLA